MNKRVLKLSGCYHDLGNRIEKLGVCNGTAIRGRDGPSGTYELGLRFEGSCNMFRFSAMFPAEMSRNEVCKSIESSFWRCVNRGNCRTKIAKDGSKAVLFGRWKDAIDIKMVLYNKGDGDWLIHKAYLLLEL